MLSFGCEEYRDLRLKYEVAKRRLWRYTHPQRDPVLGLAGVVPHQHRVQTARADENELAQRLREHQDSCAACRVTLQMPDPDRSLAS